MVPLLNGFHMLFLALHLLEIRFELTRTYQVTKNKEKLFDRRIIRYLAQKHDPISTVEIT